ncbi:hypothetical protein ACIBI4_18760 [Streptomyces sp. NPDC050418]|uniref:hypothetical protein n=1 Tax=Streptomyces sp. NPDC050418 TaxID=3365612 RepID=UPI00379B8682
MRRLPLLVIAAVSTLTLAACGAQNADGTRTDAADSKVQAEAAANPETSPEPGSPDELRAAFTLPEALRTVQVDCGGQDPAELLKDLPQDGGTLPEEGTSDEEPGKEPVPLPGDSTEKPGPDDLKEAEEGDEAGREDQADWEREQAKLDKVEKCVSDTHTKRVTKALEGRAGLTPAAVADTLRDLGYPAERLVAPAESAGAVRFTLDLSVPFAPSCLSMGTADGKVAAVPHHDYRAGDGIPESEERCEQRKANP